MESDLGPYCLQYSPRKIHTKQKREQMTTIVDSGEIFHLPDSFVRTKT